MEVIPFRKGPEVILPNGKSLGFDTFELGGRLFLSRVLGEYSELRVHADFPLESPLQTEDLVRVR